jgi:hypothetical protein
VRLFWWLLRAIYTSPWPRLAPAAICPTYSQILRVARQQNVVSRRTRYKELLCWRGLEKIYQTWPAVKYAHEPAAVGTKNYFAGECQQKSTRPYPFLIENGAPLEKTHDDLRRKNNMVMCSGRVQTKENCAFMCQQQFTTIPCNAVLCYPILFFYSLGLFIYCIFVCFVE